MNNRIKVFGLLVITIFLLLGCKPHDASEKPELDPKDVKQVMADVNKTMLESEEEDINDYIKRKNWQMIKNTSGLRYMIYKKGNGAAVVDGKIVVIKYQLRLLNDYLCYSSEKDGVKKFTVGRGEVEKGLDEGLALLHLGDKARFILPSYLAYGLLGDNNCIPKRATLIYDLELIDIK